MRKDVLPNGLFRSFRIFLYVEIVFYSNRDELRRTRILSDWCEGLIERDSLDMERYSVICSSKLKQRGIFLRFNSRVEERREEKVCFELLTFVVLIKQSVTRSYLFSNERKKRSKPSSNRPFLVKVIFLVNSSFL